MIGAVGPSDDSVEQTLNTLRYASTVHDLSSAGPPIPVAELRSKATLSSRSAVTGSDLLNKKPRHQSASSSVSANASPAKHRLSRTSSVPSFGGGRPSTAGSLSSPVRSPSFRRNSTAHCDTSAGASPIRPPPPHASDTAPHVNIDLEEPTRPDAPSSEDSPPPPPPPPPPPQSGRRVSSTSAMATRAPLPSPRVSLSAPPPCLSSGAAGFHTDKENLPGEGRPSTAPSKIPLSPVPDSPCHETDGRFGAAGAPPLPSCSLTTSGDVAFSPLASPLVSAISAKPTTAADGASEWAPPSPATLQQLLEAHRSYIADAVAALDMHTTIMSQAEAEPEPANYVGATHALIKSEMAMLLKLQRAMEAFQPC